MRSKEIDSSLIPSVARAYGAHPTADLAQQMLSLVADGRPADRLVMSFLALF
jgi:hypothetical protein